MMRFMRIFFLLGVLLILNACFKTRAELRGESGNQEVEKQTQTQRKEEARNQPPPKPVPAVARFEEYDEQMRQMNGRIDSVENLVAQMNASQAGEKESVTKMAQAIDAKFTTYEEALKKLEAEVQLMKEEAAKPKSAAAPTPAKGKTSYDEAEELFNAKKWKDAIVKYQNYRDSYPKGKMYADATYKIGFCFHELKMKDEAKAFYDEVISKFPSSKEAKKAAFRAKSIK